MADLAFLRKLAEIKRSGQVRILRCDWLLVTILGSHWSGADQHGAAAAAGHHQAGAVHRHHHRGRGAHAAQVPHRHPGCGGQLTTRNMTMTLLGQVFVAEGEPAMFECRVEPKHDLNLSVRWYRNEEELVSAGHAGTRDT